jgi:hypothetical protein
MGSVETTDEERCLHQQGTRCVESPRQGLDLFEATALGGQGGEPG